MGTFMFNLTACRDDDDDNGGSGGGNVAQGKCIINANLGGALSGSFNSDLTSSTTNALGGAVFLVGTKLTSGTTLKSFQITVSQNIQPGTYTIQQMLENYTGGSFVYMSDSNVTEQSYVAGAEGDNNFTVKITENAAGKIKGTFSGDMFNISNQKITVTGDFEGAY